jgi:WD40 repeat protein
MSNNNNNNVTTQLSSTTNNNNQLLFTQHLFNEGIHPTNINEISNIILSFPISLLNQQLSRKTIVETNIQGKILQQAVLSAIQIFITTQQPPHHNLQETTTSSSSNNNKKSYFHPFTSPTTTKTPTAILTVSLKSSYYYHSGPFYHVQFNKEYILARSNKRVYEWKITAANDTDSTGTEILHTRHTESKFINQIMQLALSPKHDIFATGGYFYPEHTFNMKAEIVIWDIRTFKVIKKKQPLELGGIFSLTFDSAQGQLLIAGDDVGNIGVFDATHSDWPMLRMIKIHSLIILQMVFIHTTFAVISCSHDTTLGLVDVNSGKILHQYGEPTESWNAGSYATDIAYSSLFGVITPTTNNYLILWDITNNIFKEICLVYAKSTVRKIAIHNDLVLTAGSTSTTFVRLWLLPNLTEITQFDVQAKCYDITMHSSGLMFATAGFDDGKIRLWCDGGGGGSLFELMQ